MKQIASVAAVFALCVLVIGGCGACLYETHLKPGEVEFTVEGKERIAEDSDGWWAVFATDGSTYEVADNLLFGLTESTDRYRKLEVGKTYRCSTIGVRWPLFSEYKNLRDCEQVG